MALLGFLGKDKKESLNKGLEKTKESVFHKLTRAVAGNQKLMMKSSITLRKFLYHLMLV